MTRINCIPVGELTDKHLVAEYRELPRVCKLSRFPKRNEQFPSEYTLGSGHVKFFYDKLEFLCVRFSRLVQEMKRRGFKPKYETLPEEHLVGKPIGLWNDWKPTEEAMSINRMRIAERLSKNLRT